MGSKEMDSRELATLRKRINMLLEWLGFKSWKELEIALAKRKRPVEPKRFR